MSDKPAKILIIDDEEDLLYQFSSLFRSFDRVRLFTATDAKEGLQIALREKPSVISVDYRMPGMDGEALLKELKRVLPETRYIVMTGWEDGLTRDRLERIGIDAYFEKPFDLEAVLSKMMSLLEV